MTSCSTLDSLLTSSGSYMYNVPELWEVVLNSEESTGT